jgi:hypothetical protein
MDNLFEIKQYSLGREAKTKLLFERLEALHMHHLKYSEKYKDISENLFEKNIHSVVDIPFLPVSVLKIMN